MAENRTKIWKYSRKKVKWEFSLTRDSIFLTRKNEITHPLCVFFLQKIHKICTGQNKIVSLEKISSQRFNYERMDLDYEGINRNVFPFFQEAETSVSFFCLILFLLSKETGEQGMFSQGRTFSNYTIGNWGWAKTPVLPYICLSCQKSPWRLSWRCPWFGKNRCLSPFFLRNFHNRSMRFKFGE